MSIVLLSFEYSLSGCCSSYFVLCLLNLLCYFEAHDDNAIDPLSPSKSLSLSLLDIRTNLVAFTSTNILNAPGK